jgi:hypothetical protein
MIIAKFYEAKELLHEGQFSYKKQWSAIDVVAKLIYIIEKTWSQNKLLRALFMNVKDAFNYIIKERLL